MFLNRYLFGVALFANILLNVTSFDYRCVSDSYGTLESEHVLELQVNTPDNVLDVPKVCSNYIGVAAEVCSTDEENYEVFVPNLDQVLVTSDKSIDLNLTVYCKEEPSLLQDQVKPDAANVQEVASDKEVKGKIQEIPPVKDKVVEGITQAAKALEEVAQVQEDANRALKNVNRVKVGAATAQQNVNKAQINIEKAQRGVAKALLGGGKAQLRVYKAEHSILKAQKRINRAQKRIYNAQKRANKAERNVDKAQKRAEKAQKRVVKEFARGVDY